jgi:alpha-L-fucosidase 2
MINFFARLQESETAYEHVLALMRKSTQSNLFDSHPPFQIDGNFGGTAGIAEMLLQSHNGIIHLLPALPKAWSEGSFSGLCARGGFELDVKWKEGKITEAQLYSKSGGKATIKFNGIIKVIENKKDEIYVIK